MCPQPDVPLSLHNNIKLWWRTFGASEGPLTLSGQQLNFTDLQPFTRTNQNLLLSAQFEFSVFWHYCRETAAFYCRFALCSKHSKLQGKAVVTHQAFSQSVPRKPIGAPGLAVLQTSVTFNHCEVSQLPQVVPQRDPSKSCSSGHRVSLIVANRPWMFKWTGILHQQHENQVLFG